MAGTQSAAVHNAVRALLKATDRELLDAMEQVLNGLEDRSDWTRGGAEEIHAASTRAGIHRLRYALRVTRKGARR